MFTWQTCWFALWAAWFAPALAAAQTVESNEAVQAIEQRIASGASGPHQLGPLYLELARARAQQGDEEGASTAFVRLLALDPNFRLGADEADLVRSRYLEARGFWDGQPQPLDVTAELDTGSSNVVLRVHDRAGLSARVRLRMRVAPGDGRFVELVRAPAEQLTIPVALGEAERVELTLTLLDEHGNRIWQKGDDDAPVALVIARAAAVPPRLLVRPVAIDPPARRAPYLRLGTTAAVLGLGAAGVGVYAHLERERLAERWNDGRCSGGGTTRGSICAGERRDLRRMQRVAGAAYGVAGAALVGAVLSFAFMPARSERPVPAPSRLHVRQGPGELGVSCEVWF